MNVVDDLRMPDVVNLVDSDLRFDLRERIPVAIVIVTGVLVIELRRIGAFERRAECFVVPVFDDVDAVRIQ
jgi:hypothetical protein